MKATRKRLFHGSGWERLALLFPEILATRSRQPIGGQVLPEDADGREQLVPLQAAERFQRVAKLSEKSH